MGLIFVRYHSVVDLITNSSSELYVLNGNKGFSVFKKMIEKMFSDLGLEMDNYVRLIDLGDKESVVAFCEDVCGWSEHYDFGLLDDDGEQLIRKHHYDWEDEWGLQNNFDSRELYRKRYEVATKFAGKGRALKKAFKKMEDENGYTEILKRRDADWKKYMKEWEQTRLPLLLEKAKGMIAIRGKSENILFCTKNESGESLLDVIEKKFSDIQYYHLG